MVRVQPGELEAGRFYDAFRRRAVRRALAVARRRSSLSRSEIRASASSTRSIAACVTASSNASRMTRSARAASSRFSSPLAIPGLYMPSPNSKARRRRSAARYRDSGSLAATAPTVPRTGYTGFAVGRAARIDGMASLVEATVNQLRVAKRLAPRRGASLRERFGPLDERLVFVVGSPRSGTTFLAAALGSLPGFVDLGEVAPVKAAAPELSVLPAGEAARRLRRILAVSRRVGLVGSVRPVEQTPEVAHLVQAIPLAFPAATVVHIVRDGRDVVCSLLEKGWLGPERAGRDDAGIAYGSYARFWVEPERREEFARVSDARRAAWAWRRYVTSARAGDTVEIRYERLAEAPDEVARELAARLDAPGEPLRRALGLVHRDSVGRYRHDLSTEQLDDVLAEAGDLLREVGYLT